MIVSETVSFRLILTAGVATDSYGVIRVLPQKAGVILTDLTRLKLSPVDSNTVEMGKSISAR